MILCLACCTGLGVALADRSLGRQTLLPLATRANRPETVPSRLHETSISGLDLNAARISSAGALKQKTASGTVTFTIDPDLQEEAVGLLRRYELPYGAAVMIDLKTNNVIVLAGYSARDAGLTHRELCLEPWAPAASIYKLVTTAALLEQGVPAETTICYHGGLRGLMPHHLKDDPRRDTSCRNLGQALAKSINPIMGKLALRYLNRQQLLTWSVRFGFNQPIPFALPTVRSHAAIPSAKLERARVAAGFWHTEISPLHGAILASIIANQGRLRWPRVVASVTRPSGEVLQTHAPAPKQVITRQTARALTRMMVATTTEGTARRGFHTRRGRPFLRGVTVAGKTGSLSRKDPYLAYNWFVGFAPADKPTVAFAVLLGNPARWRLKAPVAARLLLERYFARERRN